jgi:hypothetical protein
MAVSVYVVLSADLRAPACLRSMLLVMAKNLVLTIRPFKK